MAWPAAIAGLSLHYHWWPIVAVHCQADEQRCPSELQLSWQSVVGQPLLFWPQRTLADQLTQQYPYYHLQRTQTSWSKTVHVQYTITPLLSVLSPPNASNSAVIDTEGFVRQDSLAALKILLPQPTFDQTVSAQRLPSEMLPLLSTILGQIPPTLRTDPTAVLDLSTEPNVFIRAKNHLFILDGQNILGDLQKLVALWPLVVERQLPYPAAVVDLRLRYPMVKSAFSEVKPASEEAKLASQSSLLTTH